jgi:hypothetical protein
LNPAAPLAETQFLVDKIMPPRDRYGGDPPLPSSPGTEPPKHPLRTPPLPGSRQRDFPVIPFVWTTPGSVGAAKLPPSHEGTQSVARFSTSASVAHFHVTDPGRL